MYTHTHGPDGRDHITCRRCGATAAFPPGDRRGIHAWKTAHVCRPPSVAAAAPAEGSQAA